MIFDGMHPQWRQVPPAFSFSIRVTSAPNAAALRAATYPPGPAPSITICFAIGLFPFNDKKYHQDLYLHH